MPITVIKSLRDLGKDEYWLQDLIFQKASVLGLGDLEPVSKEKSQSSGGRLDMLLKDPETDAMFEVEVMLGETDETHIVRTIEYWDIEKCRWPKREHTAVLVAERINSRFYNVIHLMSLNIPIIGIQVNAVEVDGKTALHFNKVIDSYEEPEIEQSAALQGSDESQWQASYPKSVELAKGLKSFFMESFEDVEMRYLQQYITLTICGIDRVWIQGKKKGSGRIEIRVDQTKEKLIRDNLDANLAGLKFKEGAVSWIINDDAFDPRAPTFKVLFESMYPKDLRKKPTTVMPVGG